MTHYSKCDLHHWLTITDLLKGNFRVLLTCKNPTLRQDAQANLKSLLSKEPNSQTKLPRFSSMLKTDLSQVLFKTSAINVNLRMVEFETPPGDIQVVLEMLKLAPDFDLLSKKTALQQLMLMLETSTCLEVFLQANGLEILIKLMDKCLDERLNHLSILPPALECLQKVLLHDHRLTAAIQDDNDKYLLYILTRCAFVFCENHHQSVLNSVLICSSLLLFGDGVLKITDSSLSLPSEMIQRLHFPLNTLEQIEDIFEFIDINNDEASALSLIKIYWNLAFFGGIHALARWTLGAKSDGSFGPKLILDQNELTLVKTSFGEIALEEIASSLGKAKTHQDFQDLLHLAKSHLKLREISDGDNDWILRLPWIEAFSRFLRTKPNTRNDEKLFMVMFF
jgi:hypothetical protein